MIEYLDTIPVEVGRGQVKGLQSQIISQLMSILKQERKGKERKGKEMNSGIAVVQSPHNGSSRKTQAFAKF